MSVRQILNVSIGKPIQITSYNEQDVSYHSFAWTILIFTVVHINLCLARILNPEVGRNKVEAIVNKEFLQSHELFILTYMAKPPQDLETPNSVPNLL